MIKVDLVTQINNFLGRSSTKTGSWVDAEIDDALNEAHTDAEIIIDEAFEYYWIAYAWVNETESEDTYDLPEDCKFVVALQRLDASGIGQAKPQFLRKIGHTQAEEEFYRFLEPNTNIYGYTDEAYQQEGSDKIKLMKPSVTTISDQLILVYIRRLMPLVDDYDESPIPREHHGYLKWRALWYLLPKEEEGGARMNQVTTLMQEKELKLKEHAIHRNIQSAKTINFIDTGEI
jgi:hypothetical protein